MRSAVEDAGSRAHRERRLRCPREPRGSTRRVVEDETLGDALRGEDIDYDERSCMWQQVQNRLDAHFNG